MTTCDQMTTIIPSFWSRATCSRTCQYGRIAATDQQATCARKQKTGLLLNLNYRIRISMRFPLSFGKPLNIIFRKISLQGRLLRLALEHGGQAIVRPNLDWCTERVEKESHSVINVKSTVAIFKQWSNISRLTAFGMTTIIPPFWSMENCSRTCQNGRIAAGRLPRPGLVFSIVASVFLLFDLSMERESATFAMTDKSPSASSSAVVASSIVDLLGAFASVFSFQGIHFAVNAYSGILKCKRSRRTLSCLSSTNSNERSPSMNCRYFRIVIQSAPCATDSVRPSGLGRSLDHGEEKHSRVMLFGVTSDKTPNLGQMLIFIVLLENLSGAVLSITKLCYSSEGFQRAEQRPQTIDRCWCRVRNGQNPTAMIMQPPNLTVDSADLALAAFRAMLLFAARAHAVRAHFICSS
ncbi:hypothetical protein T01_12980 [Trichinella spiralis]|uniref:Uncharacterized protein n=1 Tax=Trichinella spiralis TaxID=6334 RepID=A0A0V1AZJ4_TRISP|nr:hypothetical protein T01_12980 [Trichinella spiralis]